jgi:hypothetical protein
MVSPALNELTQRRGRRVRMCPLTTQVDGEERAAQDEQASDQLLVTEPDGVQLTLCRSGRR